MRKSFVNIIITLFIIGLIFPAKTSAAGGLSFISIPAAAFQPTKDCIFFNGNGFSTIPVAIDGCSGIIAPVIFPNGVNVKKVTFYWKDGSVSYEAYLELKSVNRSGVGETLASLSTNGSANEASFSSIDTSINIDNYLFSYYVFIQMPTDANAVIYSILLEYSYDTSLPLIIK